MANPIKKITNRIGANWFFLIIVLIIYLIVTIFSPSLGYRSFLGAFNIFVEIIPVIILVFFLVFVFNLFISPEKVVQYLGNSAGFKGWFLSIVFGILSSGPIYMWYPLLKDLKNKGMRPAFITAFLYNRAIKIPLLSMMVFYLGWALVIILNFYMIIFSVINGYIVEKIISSSGAMPKDGQGFTSGEKRKEKI
ncbi:MAG: permease [Patescibacteria group bacterium]|nr:permease [Patescibacteria group bacterium]